MNILAIDTSNQVLGVAIMQNGKLVAEFITNINKDHSSRLMPAIVDVMDKVNLAPEQLDEIVVANGPGSYTGTRIGVTTAKTMAWALDIPIYAVSSLKTAAYNGVLFNGYICAFFDARRKTVFTSLFKSENNVLESVIDEQNVLMEDWLERLKNLNEKVLFISPHMDVFEEMIKKKINSDAIILENPLHIPKPSNLLILKKHESITPAHQINPEYLRITEAEANLRKRQKGEING